MNPLALDASVAIPLLVQTHDAHDLVSRWRKGRDVALAGHALAETYSVLTRLPGDLGVDPRTAAQVIDVWFGPPLLLGADSSAHLHALLAECGVSGGATYDALVALAAVEHDAVLATRDERARRTYEAIGARVVMVV